MNGGCAVKLAVVSRGCHERPASHSICGENGARLETAPEKTLDASTPVHTGSSYVLVAVQLSRTDLVGVHLYRVDLIEVQ
jgi:hypothetical protein